jgi:hypothetical protein
MRLCRSSLGRPASSDAGVPRLAQPFDRDSDVIIETKRGSPTSQHAVHFPIAEDEPVSQFGGDDDVQAGDLSFVDLGFSV